MMPFEKKLFLLACVISAGHRKFLLSPQFANPEPHFNFLNPQPQVRNYLFKCFSSLPQVCNGFSGLLNLQPQIRNHAILEVRYRKSAIKFVILEVYNCIIFKIEPQARNESKKKKSKKSTKQTRPKRITIKKLYIDCSA